MIRLDFLLTIVSCVKKSSSKFSLMSNTLLMKSQSWHYLSNIVVWVLVIF